MTTPKPNLILNPQTLDQLNSWLWKVGGTIKGQKRLARDLEAMRTYLAVEKSWVDAKLIMLEDSKITNK